MANVDTAEIAKFEALASRWWDKNSEFKPLHDINPLRANFIDERSPVAQRKLIDVGCGGGILAESLAQRGYTEGFLRRHVHDEYQNYQNGSSVSERQQFVGELTGERRGELAEVRIKNRFAVGDGLELMTPQGNLRFTLEQLENSKGHAVAVAPGDGHVLYLPVPPEVQLEYGLLMRDL